VPGKVGGVLRRELGDGTLLATLAEEGYGDIGGKRGAQEDLAGVGEADPAPVE
jgi:hypothetical protein